VVQFDGQTGRLRNAVLHNCRHAVVKGADVHEVSRRAAAGVLRIRVLAGLGQATLGKLIGRLPAGGWACSTFGFLLVRGLLGLLGPCVGRGLQPQYRMISQRPSADRISGPRSTNTSSSTGVQRSKQPSRDAQPWEPADRRPGLDDIHRPPPPAAVRSEPDSTSAPVIPIPPNSRAAGKSQAASAG